MNRGHVFFKENDLVNACYVVKEGEVEMVKAIYDNKYTKEGERQILENRNIAQKFNSNFNKA